MDLRAEILKEHSKRQAIKIANWVGDDAERFEALLHLFMNDVYRVNQRAAYPMQIISDNHPALVARYLEPLVKNLEKPNLHNAVRRNTVRLLQNVEIPEDLMGIVTDICFRYLASAEEPIAVKVFSMTVLLNIARHYPDIKNELIPLIEAQLRHASSGLRNRGEKVLKELEKINAEE